MNDMNDDKTSTQIKKTQFWNRVQLIMVLVVFAAPIVGAFFYKPSGFINYGEIYTPVRPVSNLLMSGKQGEIELDSFRRQWIFLVTAEKNCEQKCENNLLKIRQLRFMQNNDMTRIRPVFMHAELPAEVANDLAAKYSPVESYRVAIEDYNEWTKILELDAATLAENEELKQDSIEDRFYIIDPAGNLVMSYPADADPNFIKADIKRLLKASQIG